MGPLLPAYGTLRCADPSRRVSCAWQPEVGPARRRLRRRGGKSPQAVQRAALPGARSPVAGDAVESGTACVAQTASVVASRSLESLGADVSDQGLRLDRTKMGNHFGFCGVSMY